MTKHTLDLNAVERTTLELTLRDDARTALSLTIPTEGLVNKLQGMGPELAKIQTGDRDAVGMIYELAADLISCNTDFFTVTAEDLRDRSKYRMDLESLLIFFSAYMDFINEVAGQKN